MEIPAPWEYICLRATRYVKGAVAPHEWDQNPSVLYPWLEYALMAEMVENELQAEELAKKTKQPARKPFHQATLNQG